MKAVEDGILLGLHRSVTWTNRTRHTPTSSRYLNLGVTGRQYVLTLAKCLVQMHSGKNFQMCLRHVWWRAHKLTISVIWWISLEPFCVMTCRCLRDTVTFPWICYFPYNWCYFNNANAHLLSPSRREQLVAAQRADSSFSVICVVVGRSVLCYCIFLWLSGVLCFSSWCLHATDPRC